MTSLPSSTEIKTVGKKVLLGIQLPSMEGYLLVNTDQKPKKWKTRYFRLEEDKMICFKTHEDMKPLSIYSVYQVVSVDVPLSSTEKIFRIRYRKNEDTLEDRFKPSDDLDTTLRLWVLLFIFCFT
jgi:hypothetical protein